MWVELCWVWNNIQLWYFDVCFGNAKDNAKMANISTEFENVGRVLESPLISLPWFKHIFCFYIVGCLEKLHAIITKIDNILSQGINIYFRCCWIIVGKFHDQRENLNISFLLWSKQLGHMATSSIFGMFVDMLKI